MINKVTSKNLNKAGIYIITNLITNKHYIGQTISFNTRFKNHKSQLINNNHSNKNLQVDYNKGYKLIFKLIKVYTIPMLNRMEKFWIKKLNTFNGFGYNQDIGGNSYSIGINNHMHDTKIYTFYNKNGKIENCTQYNLRKKYSMRASDLSSIISGRLKSTQNWSIIKNYWIHNNAFNEKKNKLFMFYHFDNKIETLSCLDMSKKYNLNIYNLLKVAYDKQESSMGWGIKKDWFKKYLRYGKVIYTFYHYSGKIEKLTYLEMNKKYKLNKGDLADIIHKRTKSASGWSLYKNYFTDIRYDKTIYTFYHHTGKIEKLTYSEMNIKYNFRNGKLSNIIHEKIKSEEGWGIKKDWYKKYLRYNKTIYTFYHIDGKIEKLTYLKMRKKYKPLTDLAKLMTNKLKTTKGWRVKI